MYVYHIYVCTYISQMTMRNNLATEGDLGGFEPRDSTKSHHTTACSMEVYCGEVQKWRLRDSRRKEKNGREGLAFYKVMLHTCAEEESSTWCLQ